MLECSEEPCDPGAKPDAPSLATLQPLVVEEMQELVHSQILPANADFDESLLPDYSRWAADGLENPDAEDSAATAQPGS